MRMLGDEWGEIQEQGTHLGCRCGSPYDVEVIEVIAHHAGRWYMHITTTQVNARAPAASSHHIHTFSWEGEAGKGEGSELEARRGKGGTRQEGGFLRALDCREATPLTVHQYPGQESHQP